MSWALANKIENRCCWALANNPRQMWALQVVLAHKAKTARVIFGGLAQRWARRSLVPLRTQGGMGWER